VPSAGTSAHAFTLLHSGADGAHEAAAFRSQVAALGVGTTLLVDTFDVAEGIRHAVDAGGPALGAIRIDSGDLAFEARRARRLLDELGATSTRVIITGDLDEKLLRKLAAAPVDGYGVGTSVVTGLGAPTAGFIYKLVEAAGRPVAKRSAGKATVGGRKWAWRLLDGGGRAVGEEVADEPSPPEGPARALQVEVISNGSILPRPSLEEVRRHHLASRSELPSDGRLPVRRRGAA